MGRAFGLLLLLVPLAIGGYLLVAQLRTSGPTSRLVTHAETSAQLDVAATNFQSAGTALQAWFVEHASYAGATLPPGTGTVIVRADASSYCIQTTAAPVQHEVGPGGTPQAGPCV